MCLRNRWSGRCSWWCWLCGRSRCCRRGTCWCAWEEVGGGMGDVGGVGGVGVW